jgi:hypothetical protein
MPIYGMANAPNVLVTGVTFENLFNIRRIQHCTRDDPMGEALLIGDALQPCCLTDWIRWIPSGLDVHRFDNVVVAGIC